MALSSPPLYPRHKCESGKCASASINSCRMSALLVEHDTSLKTFLTDTLEDKGYATRTASNAEEGLRLYRDCAPFNIVLIDHCIPEQAGVVLDYCTRPTGGIELALAIRGINRSQTLILTAFDYANAEDVPCPVELTDIFLLNDVTNFQLQRLLERIRVHQATEALTQAQLLKLQKFAAFRVRGLGRAACGLTADDLLREAQLRTLMGAESTIKGRHWNKNVDFVRHLAGVIQSISSSWKRKFDESEAYLECDLVTIDAEGYESSPIESIPSITPSPEAVVIHKEKESELFQLIRDDVNATCVLQGLLDRMTKHEIMCRYKIDNKQYQAVIRRIRMKAYRATDGDHKHGR